MEMRTQVSRQTMDSVQSELELPQVEFGHSKLGLGGIMVMAAFVGIWGVTCLVNGLGSCENLGSLGRGLVMALTGM